LSFIKQQTCASENTSTQLLSVYKPATREMRDAKIATLLNILIAFIFSPPNMSA